MLHSHTNNFLTPYDFSAALALTPGERCQRCVAQIEEEYRRNGLGWWEDIPMVPPIGADQLEVEQLESNLGIALPIEYAWFLRQWCYLSGPTGMRIWGISYKNVSMGRPWVSETHNAPHEYLVFGDYWNYADGDQLMFDLSIEETPVVAYLHEHGPLVEYFAPSFSLALWRMVHEDA